MFNDHLLLRKDTDINILPVNGFYIKRTVIIVQKCLYISHSNFSIHNNNHFKQKSPA
jgi:hypothetical protein